MRYLPILFLLLGSQLADSQPLIEFQKCFGGTNFDYPAGGAIMNSSGGYTIAGGSNSSDGQVTGYHPGTCWLGNLCSDFWVVNTDSLGNLLWESCFGGTGDDHAYSIAQAWDGGSIVCGYTGSNNGDVIGIHSQYWDAWVIKLDSMGNLQWQRCYGGSRSEFAFKIIPTVDSGYIMAAYAQSTNGDVPGNRSPRNYDSTITSVSEDIWIVKLDSSGNIQWSKNYGSSSSEWPNDIIQTSDGGYAFLGWTQGISEDVSGNNGLRDVWLGRIDSMGNLLWAKCYGGSQLDEGIALEQAPDSGFILVGHTLSHDGDISVNLDTAYWEIWIIKTDMQGSLQWEKTLGGSWEDQGASVLVLNDSSYLIAGSVLSDDRDISGSNGHMDVYLANISSGGQLQWSRCFGGPGQEECFGMLNVGDGDLLITGATYSNSGQVSGNHGSSDYWLLKLYQPSALEASMAIEPITGPCTLSDTEQIKIRVMNLGEFDFYNFPVSYSINGSSTVTEIINDTLLPGDTLLYTFLSLADFSIPGSYTLSVNVTVSGDAHAFNDNAEIEVISVEHLYIPVTMSFEDHEVFAGWTSKDIDADGRSGTISSLYPHSGTKTYTFWPAFTLSPDNQLWTSCIDLNGSTDYLLSYWMKEYDSLYPYSMEVYLNTQPDLSGATIISSPSVPGDTFYLHVVEPFTVSQTGTYYVGFRASASAGTAAIFLDDILIDINTGISSEHLSPDLFIFPNPFQQKIQIRSETNLKGNLKIFNAYGAIVHTHTIKENLTIDLSDLSEGIYFLEYRDEQRSLTKRIVKMGE